MVPRAQCRQHPNVGHHLTGTSSFHHHQVHTICSSHSKSAEPSLPMLRHVVHVLVSIFSVARGRYLRDRTPAAQGWYEILPLLEDGTRSHSCCFEGTESSQFSSACGCESLLYLAGVHLLRPFLLLMLVLWRRNTQGGETSDWKQRVGARILRVLERVGWASSGRVWASSLAQPFDRSEHRWDCLSVQVCPAVQVAGRCVHCSVLLIVYISTA
jgi:hypothetical protein